MADAQTQRARSQRTKITLSDIGVPSNVKTFDADEYKKHGNKMPLGVIIGIASKFVVRKSPKDNSEFEGLGGSFRVVPEDQNLEELESGVLFIPDAFHNMIAEKLRPMIADDPNASIRFAFTVSAVRATNPAGYSWDMRPLVDSVGANPLDEMAAAIGGALPSRGGQAAIEGPKGAKK